jgi:ABC-2 type transport system permease protein
MKLVLAHLRAMTVELVRLPAFIVPTLLFPVLLLLFFGVSRGNGTERANLIFASYAAFAVLGVAFFQFGVGIAEDRKSPWETYLRTLPAPAYVRFSARILSALAIGAASVVLVTCAAVVLMPVDLGLEQWLRLVVALAVGAVPFGLAGLALGYFASPKAALALANFIFLPLAYAGALWIPPNDLPHLVQQISPFLPTRQWAEALWSPALGHPWRVGPWAYLLVSTVLLGALAYWGYRRDEGQRFR